MESFTLIFNLMKNSFLVLLNKAQYLINLLEMDSWCSFLYNYSGKLDHMFERLKLM